MPTDLEAPLSNAAVTGFDVGTPQARVPALAGQFNYIPPPRTPYPRPIAIARKYAFRGFMAFVFGGTILFLIISYFAMTERKCTFIGMQANCTWKAWFKFSSIPLVSVIFTWWHVWLGIKMCFYPVEFVGCFPPVCGWQGIVPRRAHIMAERSCDIMIGTLITVEEIIDRIEPEDFFSSLEPVLAQTSAVVLGKVAHNRWPSLWGQLPQKVKDELQVKVMEESQKMFHPVIQDLKQNINTIIDIKQMSIDVLVENKPLLVEMFQKIGEREFTFIQHVAAVMGFFLGVIQMMLWLGLNPADEPCPAGDSSFRCWGGFVILPLSGLIIGTFTNWLGITMIFRPVEPHMYCGGMVNIQGVFLKRQHQVAEELAKVICKELVNARKMLEYAVRAPGTMDRILEVYQKHMTLAINQVMGKAKFIMPIFAGADAVSGIKDEVVTETIQELPNHSRAIEEYMDRAFNLPETIRVRLQGLQPQVFEGMLHPVFQEDEWMVLLLGGVLGVAVGILQAGALGA